MSILDHAWLLARADVVAQRNGVIIAKEDGGRSVIGLIRPDVNPAGKPIWRASANDMGAWAWTRADAIQLVLDIHNMAEKARLFDLEHPERRA
ncbi:hypothetical protein Gompeii16_91 [Mycobacterium phage Gompeii16]|uniref:hypothetical protein n=1 Tax=Mycobacterium phage Gompeii16 TaxID=1873895 RepID=UPI000810FCB8|nr:hypothetical protein Gompeii16_91 [Mycobacterium phage Gompeii16]ANU79505.1 hypothetical protein Gompeii16_91 [Mycobacterium phage Gompeii16]ANU79603.1 hypothetical protein SEA_BIRCSAK_91 [Mycobacterium phage Bircsak]